MNRLFVAVTVVAGLILLETVIAGAPRMINYQGVLTDADGKPVNGDYSIIFAIYDDPVLSTPANILWQEIHPSVTVTDGLFSVLLGTVTPLGTMHFTDTARYLGIKVGEDPEISPRYRFASAPFSFQSVMSDFAGYASTIADNAVTGASILDGSIGFGDIGQNGAGAGQVMKWQDGAWTAGNDETGGGGWNWSDSSSHGPDSVLYADTGSYAGRVQTIDGATGGEIYGDIYLHSLLAVGDMSGDPGQIEITNGAFTAIQMTGDLGGGGTFWAAGADGAGAIAIDGRYGTVFVSKSGAGGKMYLQGGGDSGSYISMYDPSDFNTVQILSSEDGADGARIELYQANQELGIVMDGDDGGGEQGGGVMYLYNSGGYRTVKIDGSSEDDASIIYLRDAIGNNQMWLDPDAYGSCGAELVMLNTGIRTVQILASESGSDGSRVFLFEADGDTAFSIDAEEGGSGGGILKVYDDNNTETVHIDGHGVTYGGAQVSLSDYDGTTTISLDAASGGFDGGASVVLQTGADPPVTTIHLDANDGGDGGGIIKLYDDDGTKTVHIDGHGVTYGGAQVSLNDHDGTTTISFDAESGASDGGANVKLLTGTGTETIRLDADYGGTGEGRVITSVLEITGGADLSEQFNVRTGPAGRIASPGMLVCIDPDHPGELVISGKAYDPTVAGIISGAGGVKPGMLMAQTGSVSDGRYAVALTGRVYCLADASYGPIRPGDLLTTSNTPGHAMKVSDFARSRGAVIGKAMTGLESGTGLALVLVSLQ